MTTLRLLLGVVPTEDLRSRESGRQDDLPTWRLRRRHLHVSTRKLHGDGGGISPRMSIEEKHLRLKTSAEDVVPKVQLLHQADWLPPVRLGSLSLMLNPLGREVEPF